MSSSPSRLVIGPMLRHVTDTSATIFVETDGPATVTVRVEDAEHRASTFAVRGHHYALVVVRGLSPDSVLPYEVEVDGSRQWPHPDWSHLPPSTIRTLGHDRPIRTMFGSCRTAAPHQPPWILEPPADPRARGVDALWAHAHRMTGQDPLEWPDLLIMAGDQIYADDASPETRARIERRRADGQDLDPDIVFDFEEYCWLYHESWRPTMERWLFSVVPSVMIFDDHDMIDDWNISASWLADAREQPWWQEHVLGGLMSYWIHQHLGNLSPDEVEADPVFRMVTAEAAAGRDAGDALRHWACDTDRCTPVPGGYRFSFVRDLGRIRLVVLDARNGRVLDEEDRAVLDETDWAWFVDCARADVDHLVVVSSLPVFVPGALHDLQVWDEALAGGAWGRRAARVGERIRRSLDLEDWPAFPRSFADLVALFDELTSTDTGPSSVTVISGDIHFSYLAEVTLPGGGIVHQVVCSPLRNALSPPERATIRFALSRPGRAIGRVLRRSVRREPPACRWELAAGPVFANCVGLATFRGDVADVRVEQASLDGRRPTLATVFAHALTSDHAVRTDGFAAPV